MIKDIRYFRPTIGQCLILFVLPILTQLVLAPVLSLTLFIPEDYSLLTEILQKPVIYILSFLPCLIYARIKGKQARMRSEVLNDGLQPLPVNKPDFGRFHPVLFFVLTGIAMLALGFALGALMEFIPTPEWFKQLIENMVGGNIYVSLFTVGICAALFEEFVFRGIIERGLLANGSPIKAILWSAVLFALVHMNPWQAIPAFVFGIFMGWVYYRTHCLWATIFLHFVNNTSATILPYLYPELDSADSYRELFSSTSSYYMAVAISIGILAIAFFLISKYTKPANTFKEA